MSDSSPQPPVFSLLISDGDEWRIAAGDRESEPILERLAEAMTLDRVSDPHINTAVRNVSVKVSDVPSMITAHEDNGSTCLLPRIWQTKEDADFSNFLNISAVITTNASATSAILLHSALAEHNGKGVIFAAPSGTGKSTASRRLPHWWKSLCDDTTIVVRDTSGSWRAHPWPTWSAFWNGGQGGSWDTSYSVPLEAIFFLSQSEMESMEHLGKGEGLIRLVKASAQVSLFAMKLAGHLQTNRTINQQRFSNLTDLAAKVPMYMLNLSLNGEFWKHIERVIDDKRHISHSPGAQWIP